MFLERKRISNEKIYYCGSSQCNIVLGIGRGIPDTETDELYLDVCTWGMHNQING